MSEARHISPRLVWRRALAIGVLSGAAILIVGLLALGTQSPTIAPPLGATAFLVFRAPTAIACAPRNVLLGHALALAAGWLALVVCGAADLPPALAGRFHWEHAVASASAIVLTSALMVGLAIEHPPACATTLVVAHGLLKRPEQFVALELGALVVVAIAFVTQRVQGGRPTLWAPRIALPPT